MALTPPAKMKKTGRARWAIRFGEAAFGRQQKVKHSQGLLLNASLHADWVRSQSTQRSGRPVRMNSYIFQVTQSFPGCPARRHCEPCYSDCSGSPC